MKNEQRYHLNKLADTLVTKERFKNSPQVRKMQWQAILKMYSALPDFNQQYVSPWPSCVD